MSEAADGDREAADVVVVGGGPTGCSVGVFTSRYGLDTVIFDRGNAALQRCAFVENYPGFPGGIDVGTLYDLLHDHAERAGCDRVEDTVERVEERDDGFLVETQDGREVDADYVVTAAWYDGSYLKPIIGDDPFETHEHGDEEHEHLDPDYADPDGRTPVDDLYVAAPAGEWNAQAIVAAGHGAHVARRLLADHKRDRGFPDGVAPHYDWMRPESEFAGEWSNRDRWREWFHGEIEEQEVSDERLAELREAYIDRAFDTKLTDEEIEARTERAHHRLLDHLDDDHIRSYVAELDD